MIAIILAGASSMLVSLFGTRYLIVFFRQRGQGQPILGKEDHGPEHHMVKQGTPTMGGIAIVGALVVAGRAEGTTQTVLGVAAIAMATFNVIGGFMVTDRMLEMFGGKKKAQEGHAR